MLVNGVERLKDAFHFCAYAKNYTFFCLLILNTFLTFLEVFVLFS